MTNIDDDTDTHIEGVLTLPNSQLKLGFDNQPAEILVELDLHR